MNGLFYEAQGIIWNHWFDFWRVFLMKNQEGIKNDGSCLCFLYSIFKKTFITKIRTNFWWCDKDRQRNLRRLWFRRMANFELALLINWVAIGVASEVKDSLMTCFAFTQPYLKEYLAYCKNLIWKVQFTYPYCCTTIRVGLKCHMTLWFHFVSARSSRYLAPILGRRLSSRHTRLAV